MLSTYLLTVVLLLQVVSIYIIFREIDRGVERSMRSARRRLSQELPTAQPTEGAEAVYGFEPLDPKAALRAQAMRFRR